MKTQGFQRIFLSFCLTACLAGSAATAQTATAAAGPTTAQREVILTFTSKSFQQIVQSLGFETTRAKDAQGKEDDYFSFRAEGYKVVGFVDDGYLQLYMGFTDVKPTLKAVNEWNAHHALTRAYADKEGSASLESDLFTKGGITRENVEIFIKTFRDLVGAWAEFAQAHQS